MVKRRTKRGKQKIKSDRKIEGEKKRKIKVCSDTAAEKKGR